MVQTAENQLFVAPVSPTEPLKPDVFHSQTLSPLEIVLFATFTHYRSICEAHFFQKTTFYHVRHGYLLVSRSHFILWGAILTLIALAVYFLWRSSGNPAWNLLWFAMPAIGYPLAVVLDKDAECVPSNLISNLLGWTWGAFGAFAVTVSLCALLFAPMNLTLVIILLFGFAESISGMILKNLPIVIAGFLTGVLGVIAAVKLSGDCSQMLLFVLAGVILALTGVCVKCLRK